MRNMTRGMLMAALVLAFAPLAFAQDNMVGQEAPEFDAKVCVNQPEATTLEQCAGEVVLIKYWGTR